MPVKKKFYDSWTKEDFLKNIKPYLSGRAFTINHGIKHHDLLKLLKKFGYTLKELFPNCYSNSMREGAENFNLDLENEYHAYFYGFCLADGTLVIRKHKNHGAITIKLNNKDKELLENLKESLPWKSTLVDKEITTPYHKNSTCKVSILRFCGYNLRKSFLDFGFPNGSKSEIAKIPNCKFNEIAFWRGFFDGDGSLGINSKGITFFGLGTKSPYIRDSYLEFVKRHIETKMNPKNNKNGFTNITMSDDKAIEVITLLYKNSNISMSRKQIIANKIIGRKQKDLTAEFRALTRKSEAAKLMVSQ